MYDHKQVGNIEIFIGSPIEYDSERIAFQHILKLIHEINVDAVIIANANMDKVQVDLIVAFENTAFVFEVKGCHTPLRGDVNGLWARKHTLDSEKITIPKHLQLNILAVNRGINKNHLPA